MLLSIISPYGTEPPQDIDPKSSLFTIIISIGIAVILILILMKIKAELFLRLWFFVVITLALGITFNSLFLGIKYSSIIALIIALPLAIIKVFRRNIIFHNLTELLIYPGIAAIFVPLLSVWTVVLLLLVISVYDIYAVWHSGFMQKMAKYQIQKVRVFSGFFVPYINSKTKALMKKLEKLKKGKSQAKKVNIQVAILGGGDVVFPMILAGSVLFKFGLIPALIISLGATLALAFLFYISEKGKFYPAMPFISAGCLFALGIVYFFV